MMPLLLMLFLGVTSLVRQTFDDGPAGWIAAGTGGTVRMTHEAADVKSGKGALAFDYTVGGGVAVLALPLQGMDISKMDRVSFWIKSDVPTPIAVVFNEKKPGGDYSAICWSTGNTWQRVELDVADFQLNAGPKDPVDPDGKLDLHAVQSIGIVDVSSMLGTRVDDGSPVVMDSHAGKHSFFLDDFEVSSESGVPGRENTLIDDFRSPQLQWLTLGGATLKPENAGMRAVYEQKESRFVVLSRRIGNVDLRSAESVAFDVASDRPAQLLLTLEEEAAGKAQGPRYNLTLEVPGGGKVDHREVQLSAFEHAEDGPADVDGKLDLDKLKSFLILDITGNFTHESARNSLWVGNIRGVK